MSKNFNETVRFQSEKRQEWIREIIGERLQGIAEGASSALRLASSSSVSFPGRNECPGTHCSLIEQEEKEDSSCQICQRDRGKRIDREEDRVARTERESHRSARLVGAAETSKERAKWRRLQRKNLNILGLPKRKEWPQYQRESNWQVRQSRFCQKEKSRLSKVTDRKMAESKGGREPHLGGKEGDQSGSMERKGWTPP